MMFRWISSVPPPSRNPGTPSTNSDQANVPHSPVSASSLGPSARPTRCERAARFSVSASFDSDISAPIRPALAAASARARITLAAATPACTRA